MRRREFMTLLGGAATWPLAARAQQPTGMRLIGILFGTSAQAAQARGLLNAISQGLKERGWIEGQNFTFDYRFANGKEEELPKLAAELVQSRLDAILTDGTPATAAAKNVSRTVPIVAVTNDPVGSGFARSLNQPGGNVTGVSLLGPQLAGKRLQLLKEVVGGPLRVTILSNPSNPSHALILNETQLAAQSLGLTVHVVEASAPEKLEDAFTAITATRAGALIILPDALLFGQHPRVVAYAATAHLPALFPEKQVVDAGGLMAYGPSITASFGRLAFYADKILRGASPADLPIEQPTTFELAINLKTASVLHLNIPPGIIAIADEVVE